MRAARIPPPRPGGVGRVVSPVIIPIRCRFLELPGAISNRLSAVRSPIQPTPAPVLPTILHPRPPPSPRPRMDRALAHRWTGFLADPAVSPKHWISAGIQVHRHRFACVRPGIRSFTGRLSPGLSTRVTKPTRNLLRTEPVILAGKEVDGLSHRVPVFGVGWREPQGRGT